MNIPVNVILPISVIMMIQIYFVLFAYGKDEGFYKIVNNCALFCIKKIRNIPLIKELKPFSKNLYVLSINVFVASTLLALSNIDSNPIYGLIIYILSLILYTISFSLKFNEIKETFEKDYLIEFLIATSVGLIFVLIDKIYGYFVNEQTLNKFDWAFCIIFIIFVLYYHSVKKHNKT